MSEYSGLSVNYYKLPILHPINLPDPYIAECDDIIHALGLTFEEGCVFKAIWRSAAMRQFGLVKAGAKEDGVYDGEKISYYGPRILLTRVQQRDGFFSQDSWRQQMQQLMTSTAPEQETLATSLHIGKVEAGQTGKPKDDPLAEYRSGQQVVVGYRGTDYKGIIVCRPAGQGQEVLKVWLPDFPGARNDHAVIAVRGTDTTIRVTADTPYPLLVEEERYAFGHQSYKLNQVFWNAGLFFDGVLSDGTLDRLVHGVSVAQLFD